MTPLQIRSDIYEKHQSLFGDKRVNGRTVNVEDLITTLTRETKDEFRTLLGARHAFQEQVGRRERAYGFLTRTPDHRRRRHTATARHPPDARRILRPHDGGVRLNSWC
jgi:hypothetical protein